MSNQGFPDDEWNHISNSISALIMTIGSMHKSSAQNDITTDVSKPGRFVPMKRCPKCNESPPSTITSLTETISSLETFTSDFIDSTITTSNTSIKKQQLEDNKLMKYGTQVPKNKSSQLSTVVEATPSPILDSDVTLNAIGEHHRALATSLNNFLNKLKQSTKALTNLTNDYSCDGINLNDDKLDLSIIEELSIQPSELTLKSNSIAKPVYKDFEFPSNSAQIKYDCTTATTPTSYAFTDNVLPPTFYSQTYQPKCNQVSSMLGHPNEKNDHNTGYRSQVDDYKRSRWSKKKHDKPSPRKKKCNRAKPLEQIAPYHQKIKDQSKSRHFNLSNWVADLPICSLEQKLAKSSATNIKHNYDGESCLKTADLGGHQTGTVQNREIDQARQTIRVHSSTDFQEKSQISRTPMTDSNMKPSECIANLPQEKRTELRSRKKKKHKSPEKCIRDEIYESELGKTAVDEDTDIESYPSIEDQSNTLRSKHLSYTSDSYPKSHSTIKKVNSDSTTSSSSNVLPQQRKRSISTTKGRSKSTEKHSRIPGIIMKDTTNDQSCKTYTLHSKHVCFTSDSVKKSQIPLPQRTNANLTPQSYNVSSRLKRAASTSKRNKQKLRQSKDWLEEIANKNPSAENKMKHQREALCSDSLNCTTTTFNELQSLRRVNSDVTISISYNTIAPEQQRARSTSEGRDNTYKYLDFHTTKADDKEYQSTEECKQPIISSQKMNSDLIARRSYIPVLSARSPSMQRKQNPKRLEGSFDVKPVNIKDKEDKEDTVRDEIDDTTIAEEFSRMSSKHTGVTFESSQEKDFQKFFIEEKNIVNDGQIVKPTDENYPSVKRQSKTPGSKRNFDSLDVQKLPTEETGFDLATLECTNAVLKRPKGTRSKSRERSNNLNLINNQSGTGLNVKDKETNEVNNQYHQRGDQTNKVSPKHINFTSDLSADLQLQKNSTNPKCTIKQKRIQQSMISDTNKETRSSTVNSKQNRAIAENKNENNKSVRGQSDTLRFKDNNLNSNSFHKLKPPTIREVNSDLASPRCATLSQRKRTRSTSRGRSNPKNGNNHSNSEKVKPNKDGSDDQRHPHNDDQSDKLPLKYVIFGSDSEKSQSLLTQIINPALTTYKCYNVATPEENHDRSTSTERKRQDNHDVANSENQADRNVCLTFTDKNGLNDQDFQMIENLIDILGPGSEDLSEALQLSSTCETKLTSEENPNLIYREDDSNLHKEGSRKAKKPLPSSHHKSNYGLVTSSSCNTTSFETKRPRSASRDRKQNQNIPNVKIVSLEEKHDLSDNTSIEGQYYISPLSGTSFNSDSSNILQPPLICENNSELATFEYHVNLPKIKRITSNSQDKTYDPFYTEIVPVPRFTNPQKPKEAGGKRRIVKPTKGNSNKCGVEESNFPTTNIKTAQLSSNDNKDSKAAAVKHFYTRMPRSEKNKGKKCEPVDDGCRNNFEDLQQQSRNNTNFNANQSDTPLSKPVGHSLEFPKKRSLSSTAKTDVGKKKLKTNSTDNKPDTPGVRQRAPIGDGKRNSNINKNHPKAIPLHKTRLPSTQRVKSILAKFLNVPSDNRQVKKKNCKTSSNEQCASRQGVDVGNKKREPNVTKIQMNTLSKRFNSSFKKNQPPSSREADSALTASKCRGNASFIPKCARLHSDEKKSDQSNTKDSPKGYCKKPKDQVLVKNCNSILKSIRKPPSPNGEVNRPKRVEHTPSHLPVSSSILNISSLNRKTTPASRENKYESNINNAENLNDSGLNNRIQPITKQKNEDSIELKNISAGQQHNKVLQNYLRFRREGHDPNQNRFKPNYKEQNPKPELNSCTNKFLKLATNPDGTDKTSNTLKTNKSSGNLDMFKRLSNTNKIENLKTAALFQKPSYCNDIWIPNCLQFDSNNEKYFLNYNQEGSRSTPCFQSKDDIQGQEYPEITISNYNDFIVSNAKSMIPQYVAPGMQLSSQFIVLSLHSIRKNSNQKSKKEYIRSTCDGTGCDVSKPTCPGTTSRKPPEIVPREIESSSSDSIVVPGNLKKERTSLPEAIKSTIASSHASVVKDLVTELDQGMQISETTIEKPKYEPDIIQRVIHNIATNFEAADRIQNLLDELEYEQAMLDNELICTCKLPSGCSTSRCKRHDCNLERERVKMERKTRLKRHVGYANDVPSDDKVQPTDEQILDNEGKGSKSGKRGSCGTCFKSKKEKD